LRSVARLTGTTLPGRTDAARAGAQAAGLAETIVTDILSLEQQSNLAAIDAARLFPSYLEAVEQLARTVDGWRA
jgi:hypothetical protein